MKRTWMMVVAAIGMAMAALAPETQISAGEPSTQPSARVSGEGAVVWRYLFNGKDLAGWINTKGWKVEDGVIARVADGSDMWTADRFGDFILEAEFKTAGNSGIFIRTDKIGDSVQTGIEVQVLDSWDKPKPSRTDCGAIYECLAPSKNVMTKDWNKVRITAKANKIQIEMNGQPIIDMDLDQWTTAHKNPDGSENKFNKPLKDFSRMGHIGLQNHGSAVWYRNIRIQPLGPVVADPRRSPPQ